MRANGTYRVTDLREPVRLSDRLVSLVTVPGGLRVFTAETSPDELDFLEWNDESEDGFIDHEAEDGTLFVTTAKGMVMFKLAPEG